MLKFLLTSLFLALLTGLFYAPMPEITEETINPSPTQIPSDLPMVDPIVDYNTREKMAANIRKPEIN